MKTRITLAVVLCLAASCAWGEARVFVDYPTLGECMGDSVRLRSKPNTDSKILGKLDEGDKVVVLDKVKSGKDTWYEIESPAKKEKAYVFGKYLAPAYRQEYQRSPKAKMWVNILRTYGHTPEKIAALSGKPKRTTSKEDGFTLVTKVFENYRILYVDNDEGEEIKGYLKGINVTGGNKPFGNIRIGDSVNKLRRELGDPEEESGSLWEYNFYLYGYYDEADELVDACTVKFTIKNSKVSSMYCYNRDDGEEEEPDW